MTLPIDRTPLAQAQANQVAGKVASAQNNIDTHTNAYNTIDELNQKVNTHADSTVLSHPDGSVTGPKIKDGTITTPKYADGSVTGPKIANESITADKFVPGALTNDTQNALRITALQVDVAKIAVFPQQYGAKGDGVTNDTSAIQQALTNHDVVDLNGKTYVSSALIIKSNQTIKNGKLICNNVPVVLYGNNTNNVRIENVEIDGSNTSEKAIFIWTGNNIFIDNCNIRNLITIDNESIGVWLKLCAFSKITRCSFNNIVGIPNGIIGDALGASRAIYLERCTNCLVDMCKIQNILSTDDGDGIHLLDANAGNFPPGIETDSLNVISNCLFKNCERSSIKIQQSGVLIVHNDFVSDATQTSFMDYVIRVYGSNVTIKDNRIECHVLEPIHIGNELNIILKNIIILNNYIKYDGTAFQACVIMHNSPSIENVLIDGNNFLPVSATTENGIYIRTYVKNIRVINNKMVNVKNAVYIRDISGITPVTESAREKIIVANNDCVCGNNLVFEEAANIYDGLVVVNNHINITSPLSFAQNSVRISDAQFNNNPIIADNRIKNSGFIDGVRNNGPTSIRPTAGLSIGFKYFDTTIGKPIWWNGSLWKDATGTTV